ncbi:MAG: exo-alpha-sialidase [Sinobacteraceae bacterium]|nr:exo-alpha-sialidase [Nevskiaceae bacterium]MBV9318208.1 exo-alpha-sialidase [Gammaproteobacteria bacterium]
MDPRRGVGVVALLTLAACGGGGGDSNVVPVPPAPPFTSVPQVRVSQPSTFASGCDGVAADSGTVFPNTAVEPYLVINPFNGSNLVAAWQQDRWSNGGSRGLMLASSFDGGNSWTRTSAPFSRCTGGNASNLGDYARATDPWLAASPNGFIYALSLSFTGGTLAPGSSSAMLVARSNDFGVTWLTPHALIQDGDQVFNDKGSITADPVNSSYVYAVWDRMTSNISGPTYFAVTADSGSTWQSARNIYDPGPSAQTIGNQIVVLPGDLLLNFFTEIDTQGASSAVAVRVIRSVDNGAHWSIPATVSDIQALGTSNPANNQPVRDGSELVSVSANDGMIYVAWQDSRFSMGKHDGIALVHSSDGGHTWSAPVQVNADVNVQAFTPTVNVGPDGVVAVTYFDLRNNTTPSTSTLYADCWLVISSDGGVTFTEQHLSGSSNLYHAPDAEGLFLGDYQALVNTGSGGVFLPFYAQPQLAAGAPATDALISFPAGAAAAASMPFAAAPVAAAVEPTAEVRRRITARTRLVQSQRLRGR